MKMQEKKKIYYDLMYLVSCALSGKTPALDRIDLESVGREAEKDSILPLIGKVVPQFRDALYKNIYRNVNFEGCKRKLYRFFDEKGIWHCSLKGMVTKDLYPNNAMRFLADYDVLFDESKKSDVRKWYVESNAEILYLREVRWGEKEDSILLNKKYHFELHYCLLNSEYGNDPWYTYFSNEELKKRLVRVSEYEYKMTNEDFYLFFLIHSYKHSFTVCDIRELIDCYLINSKMSYNRSYVEKKLSEFGLADYENNIRIIGKKLMSRENLTDKEEQYFFRCASNNTFGDVELNVLRRIANGKEITPEVRKKAIRSLFITPPEMYKLRFSFIYRSVVLRPAYHVCRIAKRLIDWNDTKEIIKKYKYLE